MVVIWTLLKPDNIFNKIQTITTLVEQCTDKQTLYTNDKLTAWHHNRNDKVLFGADKTSTSTNTTT